MWGYVRCSLPELPSRGDHDTHLKATWRKKHHRRLLIQLSYVTGREHDCVCLRTSLSMNVLQCVAENMSCRHAAWYGTGCICDSIMLPCSARERDSEWDPELCFRVVPVRGVTDSKNLCIEQYDKFFEEYWLLPILHLSPFGLFPISSVSVKSTTHKDCKYTHKNLNIKHTKIFK